MKPSKTIGSLGAVALFAVPAQAQLDLSWNTIDGGGGTSTGGPFTLAMTMGQPDAGSMTGGGFTVQAGFWVGPRGGLGYCYPNCDGSTGNPRLTANDFQCFLNSFAAGESYANCDGSTGVPALTANDFQCFLNAFAAGCP
jgi:hypothetical protein